MRPRTRQTAKDRLARWISFLALAALLAMATLPGASARHDAAASDTTQWSAPWHG
ncbi:MAG: hypothetical protein ACREQB_03220 [Candidatus Binataceae bacterium]